MIELPDAPVNAVEFCEICAKEEIKQIRVRVNHCEYAQAPQTVKSKRQISKIYDELEKVKIIKKGPPTLSTATSIYFVFETKRGETSAVCFQRGYLVKENTLYETEGCAEFIKSSGIKIDAQ